MTSHAPWVWPHFWLRLQLDMICELKRRSTAFGRLSAYAHWLQTHKHLKLVMTLIALCCESANKQMDGRTDRRYQVHYLPRFVVDNDQGNMKKLDHAGWKKFSELLMSSLSPIHGNRLETISNLKFLHFIFSICHAQSLGILVFQSFQSIKREVSLWSSCLTKPFYIES